MSAGSDAQFIAFVHARSAALLRLAVLLTGDRNDGEDLLQIALTKAYLSWWRLRRPDLAEAYVRRTAPPNRGDGSGRSDGGRQVTRLEDRIREHKPITASSTR